MGVGLDQSGCRFELIASSKSGKSEHRKLAYKVVFYPVPWRNQHRQPVLEIFQAFPSQSQLPKDIVGVAVPSHFYFFIAWPGMIEMRIAVLNNGYSRVFIHERDKFIVGGGRDNRQPQPGFFAQSEQTFQLGSDACRVIVAPPHGGLFCLGPPCFQFVLDALPAGHFHFTLVACGLGYIVGNR